MVYSQWKQRLFAFLLRRILGPYLSAESSRKLHDSVEVSIQDGMFVLKDVTLNEEYLNTLVSRRADTSGPWSRPMAIRQARIHKLIIHLSLEESDSNTTKSCGADSSTSSKSSVAWRAMQLGKGSADPSAPRVSLVALVEIDGIEIVVEPGVSTNTANTHEEGTSSGQTVESTPNTSGGMMSSYIDAAMSSLRLSLQMRNFRLRFASLSRASPNHWVELGLASAYYQDVELRSKDNVTAAGRSETSYETVFHKAIDFAGITIHSGEHYFESTKNGEPVETPGNSKLEPGRIIGRTEGTGQVMVRAIAYLDEPRISSLSKTSTGTPQDNNKEKAIHRVQQDVEVSLNQHVNISIDETSLLHIGTVSKSFTVQPAEKNGVTNTDTAREKQISSPSRSQLAHSKFQHSSLGNITEGEVADVEDICTVSGMMKQYYVARQLAEANQLRGGILLPSSAFEDEGDTPIDEDQPVTFDAFFDANDQSFYHYKSVLEESIIESQIADDAQADFVHTKVKLHLLGGGVKVCFPQQQGIDLKCSHGASPTHTPEEYVLLTFDDINLSSSVSTIKSELTMSISHVEIEDSVLRQRSPSSIDYLNEEGVEIGTVLHFAENDTNGDICSSAVVSEAPCISLHICTNMTHGSPKQIEVDLDLEPLDVVCRRYTVESLLALSDHFKAPAGVSSTPTEAIASDGNKPEKIALCLTCSCPSITLSAPANDKQVDAVGMSDCFARCGYTLQNVMATPNASIGILFEDVSLNVVDEKHEQDDCHGDGIATSSGGCSSFSCDHMVLFVTYPSSDRGGIVSGMKRFDFLGVSGRVEVEPHVPVSINYRTASVAQNDTLSSEEGSFPVVPALSAFKARQEDEEKEIEDMYKSIYSSARMNELHDMEAAAGLRGAHPQESMLSEANTCSAVVEIHIPDIVGDVTRKEAVTLLQMVLAITKSTRNVRQVEIDENNVEYTTSGSDAKSHTCVGVAFRCDQVCLSAHVLSASPPESSNENEVGSSMYSFTLVGDEWKAHALFDAAQLKSLRMLAHDISLYEVDDLVKPGNVSGRDLDVSVRERCGTLRDRNTRNPSTFAVPILYRSQMFSPMSPESPALLLDVVSQAANGDNCEEWSIYFTAYNITYRYDVDSAWLEQLQRLVNEEEEPKSGRIGATAAEEAAKQAITQSDSEATSLTRVFVSLSDCNLDYSSSKHFKTPSRTIVRLGDVRLSSNLVNPSGEIQAYRIAVNDVSTHLSNSRSPYCSENARLARASALMRPEDLVSSPHSYMSSLAAPETALQELNFITVATLDSMDVLLAIASGKDLKELHWDTSPRNEPLVTASLSVGNLYLYACKDSFACLMDTINEWQLKITGLTKEQVEILKTKSVSPSPIKKAAEKFFDTISETTAEENEIGPPFAESQQEHDLSRLEDMNILSKPLTGLESEVIAAPLAKVSDVSIVNDNSRHGLRSSQEFLLDGYDWTTVDHEWTKSGEMHPGEEHSARWYSSTAESAAASYSPHLHSGKDPIHDRLGGDGDGNNKMESFRIYPQHIPLNPTGDAFSQGDMDAPKLAGTAVCPPVQTRVMIRDLSLRCRFFDGYDWPKSAKSAARKTCGNQSFVIATQNEKSKAKRQAQLDKEVTSDPDKVRQSQRKAQLMGDLLDDQLFDQDEKKTFNEIPLPEEKGAMLEKQSETRRLARRSNRFFQMSVLGAKLRLDSFEESPAHQLASCIHLSIGDMFLAETISSSKPVKMLGEWVNDREHPRDTNDGLIMMKMACWHPEVRVSDDGEIVPVQSRVALELLPLRCLLDQRAMRFAAAFFAGEDEALDQTASENCSGDKVLWAVPPPSFVSFKVKQSKLKVDYRPEKIDVEALRDGSYVELVNLSPLNDMVITLQPVAMRKLDGFGSVVKEMLHLWIADVSSSQMYKFLTNAAPFQPISNVGGGVADFVVLPWEALRKGDNVSTAVRSGALSLAGAVAFETLNTTAKLTKYAAEKLASLSRTTTTSQSIAVSSMLPSRPQGTPRGVPSTTSHAVESLAHGLSAASYKVVIIPVREYHRQGAVGAARSVVRGIPIAIMAPLSGATEALSYTLLGARNQIRPDIRKEEEASLRGLQHSDF